MKCLLRRSTFADLAIPRLTAKDNVDRLFGTQMPTFKETCATLQPRPWAEDGLDALLDALTAAPGSPFQKAVVFCDNAGADIILGELLRAHQRERCTRLRAAEEVLDLSTLSCCDF